MHSRNLKPKTTLDFVIKGYDRIHRARVEGSGGGCIIFVKQEMQYRVLNKGKEWEMIVIEVWTKDGLIKIANFYNPCKKFSLELLEELAVNLDGKIICCGDLMCIVHCGIAIMIKMER